MAAGSTLYFSGNGSQLWKYDGDTVTLVVNIDPMSFVAPTKLTSVGDKVYFTYSTQLWTSDGTEAGTVMVKDMASDGNAVFTDLAAVGDWLYFGANSALWKTDGTEAGTQKVADVTPNNLFGFNGVLYFSADDGFNGEELWHSDGTAEGTRLFKNINEPTFDAITWGEFDWGGK